MPTYEYRHLQDFGEDCQQVVEVIHSMKIKDLEHCPYCGKAVAKMVSKPNPIGSDKDKTSDRSLARNGFTKYVKSGDGKYEKAAGPEDAPALLDRNTMSSNLDALGID